jgi:hypothetical protein
MAYCFACMAFWFFVRVEGGRRNVDMEEKERKNKRREVDKTK